MANLFMALGLMLGLVMVYSATYRDYHTGFSRERCFHMVLGVTVFFTISRIRPRRGASTPRHCIWSSSSASCWS